jgi:outer membrane lipoprotein-sorting protein
MIVPTPLKEKPMFQRSAFFLALTASVALVAQQPTLDQVVAKHIEARGGLAKIKAVKSMRMTGKMTGAPVEIGIKMEFKRPKAFRSDVTVQGQEIISAFDGKSGWSVNPFGGYGGNKSAEPMTAEQLKETEDQADMDGPLVDTATKGHKVEYLGKESIDGSDAHKLKVTLKSGNVQTIFLDSDSYLEIKTLAKRNIRGQEVESETVSGDYKEVGGLMIAHSLEIGTKGAPQRQKIQIDKVEFDVPMDDMRFKMPEKKVEPVPATLPKK